MRIQFMGLFLLVSASIVSGQQQIPNGSMEEWTLVKGSGPYKDYEEPINGWASGNGVIHVAAGSSPVCEKTTEAHSGSFGAKLVTRSIFGQIASGSLYLGTFKLDLTNPASSARRGIPFSGPIPKRFSGSYRYSSVGNDSASIYTTFSRWDGAKRVVVAEARTILHDAQAEWTTLDLEILPIGQTADTMTVVCASSAGGENFKGDAGSTLWVDDLVFREEPTSVNDVVASQRSTVTFVDLIGRSVDVHEYKIGDRIDVIATPPGFWFVVFKDDANKPLTVRQIYISP